MLIMYGYDLLIIVLLNYVKYYTDKYIFFIFKGHL